MKALILTIALLVLVMTACTQQADAPPQATAAACESLLPLRHAAREATRAGRVWTPDQAAVAQHWQGQCQHPYWAKRLAELAPNDCTGDCGAGRPREPMFDPVPLRPIHCVGGRYSGIYCY